MRGRAEERVRSLSATAGARAQVVHGLVALKGACSVLLCCQGGFSPLLLFPAAAAAVPQGPPPSTWRARSGRASCESATPRRSRRRGSCSHPVILYLFPKRAKTSVRIRKRDHRRSRILCWASSPPEGHAYPGIVVSCTALRPHTALHAVAPLCVGRSAGRLASGGASRRGLPAARPVRRIYYI